MEKGELLYEDGNQSVRRADEEGMLIVTRTDTVVNEKDGSAEEIPGKGTIVNRMTNKLCRFLETKGIRTAFVEELSDTESLVREVETIPLEVTIRNYSAGDFPEKTGMPEGTALPVPTAEFRYLKKELGDPEINGYYALTMKLLNEAEVETVVRTAFRVNEALSEHLEKAGMDLVDLRLLFGRLKGEILVACGLSPDNLRLWDSRTHEKLDRDRFVLHLGNVADAYREAFSRLEPKA